jgi:hypothetical protein
MFPWSTTEKFEGENRIYIYIYIYIVGANNWIFNTLSTILHNIYKEPT